jgi:hypothetical protein
MSFSKTLVSTVAAMAIATGAYAASGNQTGTGNYLNFPAYWALEDAGWSTNLKVVNTNTTASVLAKLVVRESVNSQEKLDFVLYLSPGDIWEGTLKEIDGKVYMLSSDDSIIFYDADTLEPVTGAEKDGGYKIPLFEPKPTNGGMENNNRGYVEIFPIAQSTDNNDSYLYYTTNDYNVTGTVDLNKAPVDKHKLYKTYNDRDHMSTTNGGMNNQLFRDHQCASNVDTSGCWDVVQPNTIYGVATVLAEAGADSLAMTYPATALNMTQPHNPVVNNVATTASGSLVEPQLTIGYDTTAAWYVSDYNAQLATLSKNIIYATYYGANGTPDDTRLVTTFVASGYGAREFVPVAWDQFEHTPSGSNTQISGGDETRYYMNKESDYRLVNTYIPEEDADVGTSYGNGGVVRFEFTEHAPNALPLLMTAKTVDGKVITNMIAPQYK